MHDRFSGFARQASAAVQWPECFHSLKCQPPRQAACCISLSLFFAQDLLPAHARLHIQSTDACLQLGCHLPARALPRRQLSLELGNHGGSDSLRLSNLGAELESLFLCCGSLGNQGKQEKTRKTKSALIFLSAFLSASRY